MTILAELKSSGLPDDVRTVRVDGREAINELPRWSVHVTSEGVLDDDALIGKPAAIRLADEWEGTERLISLVVTQVAWEGTLNNLERYTIELTAREIALTLRTNYRVFVDKEAREIIRKVLEDAGMDGAEFRTSGEYFPRPHCVQRGESDWELVERLLGQEGICHWFDTIDGEAKLCFADNPNAFSGIEGGVALPFSDDSGMVAQRHFGQLLFEQQVVPTRAAVREYDVRAPDVFIEGEAGEGDLHLYEYPAGVVNTAAAKERARVRLQQLQSRKVIVRGTTDCIRIQPGRLVAIDGCSDTFLNERHLIIAVEHHITNPVQNAEAGVAYHNNVELVPETTTYRPPLPLNRKRVSGSENAVTTGPSGSEIHVDDLGRVKLRFPWDRSGIADDTSSTWFRTLQMNMVGSMVLPRVGWEVGVCYVDGDPDRPFVLGRMYNATAVVPYGLPGAATTTSLQSASSPGAAGTNEIRMADSGGSQELFVHAQKDQTITVGGSADAGVGAKETHDVGLTLKLTVHGGQTQTIAAKQSVDVGTDAAIEVQGSRTELIAAMEANKVTANRYVAVGGTYSELIGAAYVIQCNQANTNVRGAFTNLIGGNHALTAGLAVTETVAAARTELVSGARNYTLSTGLEESVIGAWTHVCSGASRDNATGIISTDVGAAMRVRVGGAAKIEAGGDIEIKAPSITVDIGGSITAEGVKVGSGKLEVTSGSATLKGTVKRQGTSEIG